MLYKINFVQILYFWAAAFWWGFIFPMRMNEKCVAAKFHYGWHNFSVGARNTDKVIVKTDREM